DAEKLWALAGEIHAAALAVGGTVSTQHGTGLARTPWVEKQYGRLYQVFRELKGIFDPQRLFNPGKIVGPDPELPAWPLRSVGRGGGERGAASAEREATSEEQSPPSQVPGSNGSAAPRPALRWDTGELMGECLSCNGCGECRTDATAERMCPIFRVA